MQEFEREFITMVQLAKKIDGIAEALNDHRNYSQTAVEKVANNMEPLKEIATSLKLLTDRLVDGATGRKQIPQMTHFIVVGIFAICLIVLLIKDSNKSVKIDTNGIEINDASH